MSFPTHRPRRLRRNEAIRNLVRETRSSTRRLGLSDVRLPREGSARGSELDAGHRAAVGG